VARLAYHFSGAPPPSVSEPAAPCQRQKTYRNPIALAREWHGTLIEKPGLTRADLARQVGVSRARITQVLHLLDLAPKVVETFAALGNPMPMPYVTERSLRPLTGLPFDQQLTDLYRLMSRGYSGRRLRRDGPALPQLNDRIERVLGLEKMFQT
jgi:DNA-binding XRE family transcriptional regulator